MIHKRYTIAIGSFVVALAVQGGVSHAQTAPIDWSGIYAGGFGEYSGGQSTQNDNGFRPKTKKTPVTPPPTTTPPPPPIIVAADGRYGLSGGIGGGFVGYNYQVQQFVFGVEGDVGAGSITGSSASCGTVPHTCSTRINALADVRGRLGYAVGSFLPFVAGGAAFANIHANDYLYGGAGGAWRTGYTVGAGLEYKFSPRIALRVEYLHARFDSQALFNIARNVPERIGATNEIVRAGVSFYFTPPPAAVVAKY
jgi:outer membrane immunogenic protein